MDPLNLKKLNQARTARRACALITDLEDGRDRLVLEGNRIEGELGKAVESALRSGKPAIVETGGSEFFVNVYLPPVRLVVVGAVHISQAMAPIARLAGYDLEVIDPRTAFATPERFDDAALYAQWPDEVLAERPLDPYCAVAVVTHDPKIDDMPLKAALEAGCFYVGALGSRKTHAARCGRLEAEGVSTADLERIHAPIGLDIGAASPQEIAVAVMAEIIAAFRNRGMEQGQ